MLLGYPIFIRIPLKTQFFSSIFRIASILYCSWRHQFHNLLTKIQGAPTAKNRPVECIDRGMMELERIIHIIVSLFFLGFASKRCFKLASTSHIQSTSELVDAGCPRAAYHDTWQGRIFAVGAPLLKYSLKSIQRHFHSSSSLSSTPESGWAFAPDLLLFFKALIALDIFFGLIFEFLEKIEVILGDFTCGGSIF